jgi:hypothetical protein
MPPRNAAGDLRDERQGSDGEASQQQPETNHAILPRGL